jgi:hypothetical protein
LQEDVLGEDVLDQSVDRRVVLDLALFDEGVPHLCREAEGGGALLGALLFFVR